MQEIVSLVMKIELILLPVIVFLDTMKKMKIAKFVDIDVILVNLKIIVLIVLLIESIHHNVIVIQVTLIMVLILNVMFVMLNAKLVIITMLVLNVLMEESILLLVTVLMELIVIMMSVNHVKFNVLLVPELLIIVINVLILELLPQDVVVHPVIMN